MTSDPARSLRVALIGTSSVAKAHAEVWATLPGAALAAVCSRTPERAAALASLLRVPSTSRYEDVLADPGIDVVDIVTEPGRHAELASRALSAGKHVVVEKPLDDDLAAAERLVELAGSVSQASTIIAPRRFDPGLVLLKAELDAGAIGTVRFVRVEQFWARDLAYYQAPPGWKGRTGSVLRNQAIHWLDVLVSLFGFPEEVRAHLERTRPQLACHDLALVWSRHPGQVVSVLAASTACNAGRPETFVVQGDRGTLDLSALSPGRFAQRRDAWRGRLRRAVGLSAPAADPLGAQLADFLHAIRTGTRPRVSLDDGLKALRLAALCERAAG